MDMSDTNTSNSKTQYMAAMAASAAALALLSGCMASNPVASMREALTTSSAWTPVTTQPVTLKVPNDPSIQPRKNAEYSTVIVRDIGFDNAAVTISHNANYGRILFQSLTPSSFIVHARQDNGTAGSGMRYSVEYKMSETPAGYSVTFQPTKVNSYQEGLIGKFPVPDFNESYLRRELSKLQILYRFEVDSPYNSDSVTANFMRQASPRAAKQGWRDPVTGKVYGTFYTAKLRGQEMPFAVEVYPYRNGSKAVISTTITGTETSPQLVDFEVLIKEARKMLEDIARS